MKFVKKRLWTFFTMFVVVSMTMVVMVPMINVASASPDTLFYVDPPEVIDVMSNDTFLINITVTDAPETYAWYIRLSWDPALLELVPFGYDPVYNKVVDIKQGNFSDRHYWDPWWMMWIIQYTTSFINGPLDEANAEGEITIGCSLVGDVPWASGDGWLCTLKFLVEAEGSTLLNLFDTRIVGYPLDDEGYATVTYYPNLDGFFRNAPSPVHDIRVLSFTVPTQAIAGELVSFNVTVLNEGTQPETFDIYVYADIDTDIIGDEIITDNTTVVSLPGTGNSENRSFTHEASWDTTGVAGETYTISAYAEPVDGEVDTADNTFIDDKVRIAIHDVAVTSVTASPTEVNVGESVNVTVTVKNEGTETETFNVTVYADSDTAVIGDEIIIEEDITVLSIMRGKNRTCEVSWDTIGVAGETYTISAYAEPVDGEVDTADNTFIDGNVTVIWLPGYPLAEFTYSPEEPLVNEEVTFNATASYDDDGYIVSYEWDFGDETPKVVEDDPVTTHTFTEFGSYTAKLTVTDNSTLKAHRSKQITVYAPPVANFTYSPEDPMSNDTVTFNATASYDLDGSIVGYAWDFGDGTPIVELPPPGGVVVTHPYADDGNYTVTLNITDNDGLSNSTSADITVGGNRPPVALFSESAETVDTGETITFNASDSYDSDGVIVSYAWDFGDGTTKIYVGANLTAIATHEYADDGTYTVTLTVTDDDDAADSTSAVKTVLNRKPVATFTESAETVDTGETITFNASDSYDPDGSIVSYFWDFGDGTNATGVTVEHAYTDDGTYTVTLTVTDDDGANNSESATKTVKAPEGSSLVLYAVIGLGIAALASIALYALYRRRKIAPET